MTTGYDELRERRMAAVDAETLLDLVGEAQLSAATLRVLRAQRRRAASRASTAACASRRLTPSHAASRTSTAASARRG